MSLTLELSPELEAALREEAGRRGMQPEAYAAADVLMNSLPLSTPRVLRDHQAWLAQLQAWIDSHDRSVPPLPDEAVSRSSFYEDHL